MNWGIKVLQTSALPLGYGAIFSFTILTFSKNHIDYIQKVPSFTEGEISFDVSAKPKLCGADYGSRTRHLDLGKVALYQMS